METGSYFRHCASIKLHIRNITNYYLISILRKQNGTLNLCTKELMKDYKICGNLLVKDHICSNSLHTLTLKRLNRIMSPYIRFMCALFSLLYARRNKLTYSLFWSWSQNLNWFVFSGFKTPYKHDPYYMTNPNYLYLYTYNRSSSI